MRARLVRPEFWDDSLVGAMPDSVRLFYIGLWGMADDAGYLEWDMTAIAAKLYAFQRGSIRARAKRAAAYAQVLVEAGRVQVLDCDRHAIIPTLERHRIAGGNKTETVHKVHKSEVVRTSTAKSRSESLSDSSSESLSDSPRRGANGVKPHDEKAEAIARAQAKLDDPKASDEVKQSARFALQRMGVGV